MSFELFSGWIVLSFVVGFIGSSRKIGFGGAFFASLLLSPLIGLIITLVSKNKAEVEYQEEILKAQKQQQAALIKMAESKSSVSSSTSIIQELEKLKNLKDEGVIDNEEFLNLKKQILDSNNSITNGLEKSTIQNYARLETLVNGEILQFVDEVDPSKNPKVRINDAIPKNGFYKLYNINIAFEITNEEISDTYFIEGYKQKDGSEIKIGSLTKGFNGICLGNPVWLNDKPAPNGKYKVAFLENITVFNGIIDDKTIGL